jgi:serine/threonine protein kinase/WD40 repeat protein
VASCPESAEYEQFLDETLPVERQGEVAEHVAGCRACQDLLERLTAPTDPRLRLSPAGHASPHAHDTLRLGPTAAATAGVAGLANAPRVPGYELLAEVGRGGMGVVYKARHKRLDRVVALKMILASAHATPAELLRFFSEAEAIARLRHPNIVQIYEVGEHEGRPFLALEYVDGGSLAQRTAGQPQPPRAVAALVERLARAVHHAHQQGIVHRDLKPANILLDCRFSVFDSRLEGQEEGADRAAIENRKSKIENPLGHPKIADFGLAKQIRAPAHLTPSGAVLGTPQYMAPEQAVGRPDAVGPAADVYALGSILYELLAGRPPIIGADPVDTVLRVVSEEPIPLSRLQPATPRDLAVVCMKCLEKDPARRYATAEELADDLARYLRAEPIRARPAGEWDRLVKWARRRPAVAGLLGALLVTLAAGAAVSTYFAFEEREQARAAGTARDKALVAQGEARAAAADTVRAKRQSDLLAADLVLQKAVAEAEGGFVDRGLFRLVEALRLGPPDAGDFHRIVRTNLAAWEDRLPRLQLTLARVERVWFEGPTGRRTLTADGAVVRHWDPDGGRPLGAPGGVRCPGDVVEVSADGRLAILDVGGSGPPHLSCYDLADGRTLGKPFPYRRLPSSHVQISPASDFVALTEAVPTAGGERLATRCWRVQTGDPAGGEVQGDGRLLRASDGRTVLMVLPEDDGRPGGPALPARFVDLASGQDLAGVTADFTPAGPFLAWSGGRLATLERGAVVRSWDPATGRPAREAWRPDHGGKGATPVGLTADGRTAVVLGTDDRVRWYDLAGGHVRAATVAFATDRPRHLALSPDGRAVLVASWSGTARLWRLKGLSPPRPAPVNPRRLFRTAAYSPDRRYVATGSGPIEQGLYAEVSDATTGEPVGRPVQGPSWGPVFSPDGKLFATHAPPVEGEPIVARVWEVATGRAVTPPLTSPTYIHAVQFSPDGKVLAIGSVGATLLYDVPAARLLAALPQEGPVTRLLFSPDGKYLATASRSGWTNQRPGVRLWDLASQQAVGEYILTMPAALIHGHPPADAALPYFSAAGDRLITVEPADGRVRAWDVRTGRAAGPPRQLHPGLSFERAAFRSDGARLLTGYANGDVRAWDLATGQALGDPMPHPAGVVDLAFSPHGALAAVACADGTARLWDAAGSRPVSPPWTHRHSPAAIAFTTDGRRVLTTELDGTTHSWDVPEPLAGEADSIKARLEALSGSHRVSHDVVLLGPDVWQHRRAAAPPTAEDHEQASLDWHEARAREAEQDGDVMAALGHVSQLSEAGADAWRSEFRRARFLALAGRPGEAEAADRRAAALAGPERTAAWYGRCAAAGAAAADWKLAAWYLDRLVAVSPGDWVPYVRRADARERLGQSRDALADLVRAVERGAETPVVVRLAEAQAAAGEWPQAAGTYARATSQASVPFTAVYRYALACLKAGDSAAYRRTCQALIRSLGPAPDPHLANGLAMMCVLGPDAVTDWTAVERVMEQALAAVAAADLPAAEKGAVRHAFLNTYGAVLLRAGRSRDAVARLREGLAAAPGEGTWQDWLFLAAAHHRLGELDEARDCFQKFVRLRPPSRPFSWDAVEADLLQVEVEALTGISRPPAE